MASSQPREMKFYITTGRPQADGPMAHSDVDEKMLRDERNQVKIQIFEILGQFLEVPREYQASIRHVSMVESLDRLKRTKSLIEEIVTEHLRTTRDVDIIPDVWKMVFFRAEQCQFVDYDSHRNLADLTKALLYSLVSLGIKTFKPQVR
jgi:hypothetical protein